MISSLENSTDEIEMFSFHEHQLFNCSLFNVSESNDSNCHDDDDIFEGAHYNSLNLPMKIITQTCLAVACLAGLAGNTLVIIVVTRFTKMQTVTNLYILNLAIADELFVIGIPFLMVTSAWEYWPFGAVMCKMYMITTSLNQFTSSLFLTIMSADRYIAVCHPISAPKFRTSMISRLVAITAWTVSALMIMPVYMYANTLEVEGQVNCNFFFPEYNAWNGQSVFTFYSFTLAFGVPFTLIFVFYAFVILKLKSVGPKSKSKERIKCHRKVTRLVLTVILAYLICWLPYWILQMSLIFSPPRQAQTSFRRFLFLISSGLSYLNSAINPLLYALLSENFKKSFLNACLCATPMEGNSGLVVENSIFFRRMPPSLRHRPTPRKKNKSAAERSIDLVNRSPLVSKEEVSAVALPLTTQL